MVYINGDDRYCQCCGNYLGRKRGFQKCGHIFCDADCYEVWQVDTSKVVDLTAYRKTLAHVNGGST